MWRKLKGAEQHGKAWDMHESARRFWCTYGLYYAATACFVVIEVIRRVKDLELCTPCR